jgi:flagellar biosynthesis protein FlhB
LASAAAVAVAVVFVVVVFVVFVVVVVVVVVVAATKGLPDFLNSEVEVERLQPAAISGRLYGLKFG